MAGTTYQGSFYFVNKTGSNLRQRDAKEAFSVSSHVAHRYYRWARQANRTGKTESRHGRPQTPEPGHKDALVPRRRKNGDESASQPDDRANSTVMCWQLDSTAETSLRASNSPSHSPEPLSLLWTDDKIDDQYLRPELWPSYLPCDDGPGLPMQFDFAAPDWAACPRFQKEALAVLRDFFLSYGFTGHAPTTSRASLASAWHKRATDMVTDKKALHGWYASVLTFKALYKQPESFNFLYPMALKHQNTSLQLLRQYIRETEEPSESLILCIWCISNAAFFFGDFQTNQGHVSALWEAVNRLGGLDALSPQTREHVILADNAQARFCLTRPTLHYSRFDPGTFHEQVGFEQYLPLLSSMDLGFQSGNDSFLIPDDPLSDDLQAYITAHREFMAVHSLASRLLAEKDETGAHSLFSWLHRRRSALGSWTMTLYCDIMDSVTPQTRASRCFRRQLQACMCLAVSYAVSFVYSFTIPLQKWLIYLPVHNLRPQVELLLEHMAKRGTLPASFASSSATGPTTTSSGFPTGTPPFTLTHHEPLLYLFFVGACAEQISDDAGKRPELLRDRTWHSTRFCAMTRVLGLRTWKEARKVLQRFLYGDGVVLDRFVEGLFELRGELRGMDSGSERGY